MNTRVLPSSSLSILVLITLLVIPLTGEAQNRFDALRYNMVYPGQDAATMGAPSYTSPQDLGAVMYNPASTALFENSFFSFDLGTRQVREEGVYLGNRTDATATQTAITQAGFNFKAPTERGSLVFGLGYNQLADYNRAQSLWGYNPNNTITDLFLVDYEIDGYYGATAFNAWALDEFEENGDFFLESSWRPPFSTEFVGVDQYIDITERGHLGEYYLYGATEFQPGLFVGASIGIPSGRYHYDRIYEEQRPRDIENDYDIESILLEDRIRASVSGFTGRIGFIFRPTASLGIGMSAEIPGNLSIEEDFDTYIETTFEDLTTEADEFEGTISYDIRRPVRIGGGVTLSPVEGLELTGGGEWVDYSRIEFAGLDQSFSERELQRTENEAIRQEFTDVFNLHGSLAFNIGDAAKPRFGVAYYPSPVRGVSEQDRFFYSAGIGVRIGRNTMLDIGVQAANWKERVYDYQDIMGADLSGFFEEDLVIPDYTQNDIWRIHGMVGLTVGM